MIRIGWLAMVAACGTNAPSGPPPGGSGELRDEDEDGATADLDCDDVDPARAPGADEVCDGIDNDCDQVIDDAPVDAVSGFTDGDGDGYGVPAEGCARPDLVEVGGDCDDADPDRHPAAVERCDGVGDDCDGGEEGAIVMDGAPYPSIDAAIAAATDGAVITLCAGVYVATELEVSEVTALTLQSSGGRDATILEGGGRRILTASGVDLTLTGLTFRGADAAGPYGSAVSVNRGSLTVADSRFEGNVHRVEGGAVSVDRAPATFTNTEFLDNRGEEAGGAIRAQNAGSLDLVDCWFEGNWAGPWESGEYGTEGGAIFAVGTPLTVEGTTFVGNDASYGGAIATDDDSPITLVDGSFVANTSDGGGAAIYADAPVVCTGTTFDGNEANSGGAFDTAASLTLEAATLVNNTAVNYGGAIYASADVTVTDSTIVDNEARLGGGGLAAPGFATGQLVSTGSAWTNEVDDVYFLWTRESYDLDGDFRCDLDAGTCE